MFPGSDPLAPLSSRFPLTPGTGHLPLDPARPTGARPFGMRFVTDPLVRDAAKHEKRETRTTKTRATRQTSDGKEEGDKPDTETYVEITYE